MSNSQHAAMELIASMSKPDTAEARRVLDLAVSLDLPPRVSGEVEEYIELAREAGDLTTQAKAAQDRATKCWQAVREQASRDDDLVDQAMAAETRDDDEDPGSLVDVLVEFQSSAAEFKAALIQADRETLADALMEYCEMRRRGEYPMEMVDARAINEIATKLEELDEASPSEPDEIPENILNMVKAARDLIAKQDEALTLAREAVNAAKGVERALLQGRLAYLEGKGIHQNPYQVKKYVSAWEDGWNEAQVEADGEDDHSEEDDNVVTD